MGNEFEVDAQSAKGHGSLHVGGVGCFGSNVSKLVFKEAIQNEHRQNYNKGLMKAGERAVGVYGVHGK